MGSPIAIYPRTKNAQPGCAFPVWERLTGLSWSGAPAPRRKSGPMQRAQVFSPDAPKWHLGH